MNFIKFYKNNILNYDIINKYSFESIDNVPKLKFITITTKFNFIDINQIISFILNLEQLTQNSFLKFSLNFSKGKFAFKYTLKKKKIELFLLKCIWLYLPQFNKSFKKLKTLPNINNICILMHIKNFKELERFNYVENKNVIQIKITLSCKDSLFKQQSFFFKLFKFCI